MAAPAQNGVNAIRRLQVLSILLGVRLKALQESKYFTVFRDVAHAVPVVHEADHPCSINDDLSRHPPQLEEIYFLAISFENSMVRVGEADKWQPFLFPVAAECFLFFRPDHHDRCVKRLETVHVLAQLRHMPLAEGSLEPAIKDQQHMLFALKGG